VEGMLIFQQFIAGLAKAVVNHGNAVRLLGLGEFGVGCCIDCRDQNSLIFYCRFKLCLGREYPVRGGQSAFCDLGWVVRGNLICRRLGCIEFVGSRDRYLHYLLSGVAGFLEYKQGD